MGRSKGDAAHTDAAADGWVPIAGYTVGIRDGAIVARNDKGKQLAAVPKAVKDTEAYEILTGALEFLGVHRAECRDTVETWMLRSLPVPGTVLAAVWPDPDWQDPLANLVIEASGVRGLLRAIGDRGLGVVDADGETRWLGTADAVAIPHPILLSGVRPEDLDDWRALCGELGLSQGTPQLFRETFVRPGDAVGVTIDAFAGGAFPMLAQATGEARRLGYRVSGGCATCRVWEAGASTEARFWLGEGEPTTETETGALGWVDARQRTIPLAEVGPVAFSEGMRMASAIFAKRTVPTTTDGEDA
ncbi:MAG: DUF4132 domain-containing protein [Myxococcota bacterium]